MTDAVHHFEHGAGDYAKSADNRPEFDERFSLFARAIDAFAPAGGAGLTAIDLGCGPGHLTCHLASRGFRTIAIDGSETMLAGTRMRLEQQGIASVDLRRHSLPLPADTVDELAGQVDLIVMSSVIEYIDEHSAVLAQCARLLRSGGEALVSFPNRRSLYWRVQRPLRRTPIFASSASRHQRHQYDPNTVSEMAQAAGLRVCEITYFALPLQRFSGRVLPGRSPRLATLFLAQLKPPLSA